MDITYKKPCDYLQRYISSYWSWESKNQKEYNLPLINPGTGVELVLKF